MDETPLLVEPDEGRNLPSSVAMIWAFAHSDLLKSVAPHVTGEELARIQSRSVDVFQKWGAIHNGECGNDEVEPLPSFGFLRHCGTPMVERYAKDIGVAIKEEFGQETYERLRASESMRLLFI